MLRLVVRAAREGVRSLSHPARKVTVRGRGDGWAQVTVHEKKYKDVEGYNIEVVQKDRRPYQFAIQISALNR